MDININKLVEETMQSKLEDGSINKLVGNAVEEMIKKALSDSLSSWNGGASELIKDKLKKHMVTVVENYDFEKYLTKITDVLDRAFQSSLLTQHKNLTQNLKIQLEPKIDKRHLSELFEDYQKFLEEKDLESSDTSLFNFDDGNAYVTIKYEKDEESGEYVFQFDSDIIEKERDFDEYTVKMSLGTDYDKNLVIRNVKGQSYSEGIASLRYIDNFSCYLLKLQQDYTKIIVDETEGEDSVQIRQVY